METGKRQAMATIVLEGERLLNLAQASGSRVVARLIQAMVAEARATLDGHPSDPGDDHGAGARASVVEIRTGQPRPRST
jgi:hypothetical protein